MEPSPNQLENVPGHVAIIMDGNGRWARARRLPRTSGHKRGVTATRKVVEACVRKGVQILTLFAFSSENWQRPPSEVSTIMELFFSTLRREAQRLAENNIRLRFIGDRAAFSDKLQRQIRQAELITASSKGMLLNIAANYGGRWDIVQAVHQLVSQAIEGRIQVKDIHPEDITSHLATAHLRDPDLFIRTGGEQRISNFLLWQLAYTELYFTSTLWPDFDEDALSHAFESYANRQRRFGKTGEQVEAVSHAMPNA